MMPTLDFIRPTSTTEVLDVLDRHGQEAAILAGGTDLIPGLRQKAARFSGVKMLVDISAIEELRQIRYSDNGMSIGTAVTFSEILGNDLLSEYYPLLVKAAVNLGSVQIRNRATIGGNFINNAPCADSVPPLLVYEASVIIQSKRGEKTVPLSDFLSSPYQTRLEPDELVLHTLLPPVSEGFNGEFYKLGRRRGVAISRITLAVLLRNNSGKVGDIRLAAGAVTPVGIRFTDLENDFRGRDIIPRELKQMSRELGKRILQETGLRWSTAYKLPVTQQIFYQILSSLANSGG
ncbi:MAG: hypothetical protein EH225_12460 [Calditrichaeota bacterium]|nr:FAD binding domain-containing protein [Calditrichota bacterium]RQV98866.1 MAG: hypothetical protein EH225_12460 [Calditrichota bacterium]